MIDPTATDPAPVEAGRPATSEQTPAAERDDVEGHGRHGTFHVAGQPTDEDDVEGHGRHGTFHVAGQPNDEDDVEGHGTRPSAF